ncbi:MAG: hypothetical protein R3F61_20350 [Myxococcota bacterium]
MEGFRDGSGLFGIAGHAAAAGLTGQGLRALQHRGTLGVAFAVADGNQVRSLRSRGRVDSVALDAVGQIHGTMALGQVFGGLGSPDVSGLPLDGGDRMVVGHLTGGPMAVAIAGRLTNGTRLRRELKAKGALFQTESDAEVLLHLIAQSAQRTPVNRIVDALWKVEGAFSALLLGPSVLVAVRDPRGFRPLMVGRLEGALAISTEDTAIRDAGGEVQRSVHPGEMVVVDRGGVQSVRPFPPQGPARCAMELVGLARHDASVFERSPYEVREALGRNLGTEAPCSEAEVVVALPEDEPYGIGYARAANVPYERGLLPGYGTAGEDTRWMTVPAVVRGRRVVLVSRSLLTGRVLKRAVAQLRAAQAVDVHVRIALPPIQKACVYGVPSPTTDELAWTHHRDLDELALWLDVVSVGFSTHEGTRSVLGEAGWCLACVTGEHPVAPEEPDDQLPLF